jgi:Lhr-like helicase
MLGHGASDKVRHTKSKGTKQMTNQQGDRQAKLKKWFGGTVPTAILVKDRVVKFDGDDKAFIASVASTRAFHSGENYGACCYKAAREFALTRLWT